MNNKRTALKVAVLFCSLTLCSCAHYQCDPNYVGPKSRPAELLAYYSYPKQPMEAKAQVVKESRKYVVKSIELPSAMNVFAAENIKLEYYGQKKPGRFPAVLILPISGGADFSVRSFAQCFAQRGFNCVIVHNRKVKLDNTQSADEVENYFRQTVLDGRQTIDWLIEQKEVDAEKIGCLGLSLGGIKTALLCAVDERVKCCVMGLAGGSIADITISSREKPLKRRVEEFTKMGATLEDIHAELTDRIKTDTIALAPYIDARNTLMFIAQFDKAVPRECGERLRQAIGKPETIYLLSGHYGAFLYLPYAQQESLNFIRRKLNTR